MPREFGHDQPPVRSARHARTRAQVVEVGCDAAGVDRRADFRVGGVVHFGIRFQRSRDYEYLLKLERVPGCYDAKWTVARSESGVGVQPDESLGRPPLRPLAHQRAEPRRYTAVQQESVSTGIEAREHTIDTGSS